MNYTHVILKINWRSESSTVESALTVTVPLDFDGKRIKKYLENYFQLKEDEMILSVFETKEKLEDTVSLDSLGVLANGVLELNLNCIDGSYPSSLAHTPYSLKTESDVLTIKGAKGQSLNVEIVQASNKKTFLGGFVNTKTKLEYHHAEAQTRRKSNIRIDINHEDYVSQILQTKPESNKYQQAGYEKSVQTSRNPPRDDYPLNKIIIPSGHYVTAGEISELFVKNVIVIQRSVRKWRARKKILRAQQYKKDQMISDEDNVGVAPKSREDFQRLYADIEKWRNSKDNELKNNYSKDPKSLSKERAKLILEEAKQLIVIDQSKGKIRKDVHKESLVNSIIKAGKPKLWINGKGRLVKVETQDTLRAKELSDIYIKLSKTAHEGENDERREALICLADIIGQLEQCSLTSEIIQLAEREEDLRIRGFKSHQIFGLMTRIGNLFLKLIKSPLHNPAIHQSLNNKLQLHLQPSDLSLISRELPIEYCKGCRKYLSKTSFGQAKEKKSSNKNGKQNLESKCLRCGRLDNDARTRQDLSIYKDMLNYIKKDEEHLNGFDSPVFKLKDSDIRQIVVNLWGSKSILSGLNDPYDLCLVRWDKTTHWSPWNCVLLSFEEGAIHSQLSNIKKVYKYFLIERVNYRHTLARIHFAKDPYLYSYVKNESKENKVESLSIKGDTIKPNNPNGFKF